MDTVDGGSTPFLEKMNLTYSLTALYRMANHFLMDLCERGSTQCYKDNTECHLFGCRLAAGSLSEGYHRLNDSVDLLRSKRGIERKR